MLHLLAAWSLGTRQQKSYTVLCRMGNKDYVARTYWNLQRICARWSWTLKWLVIMVYRPYPGVYIYQAVFKIDEIRLLIKINLFPPFSLSTIPSIFKMFLHFLVNGQAAAAKYFVKNIKISPHHGLKSTTTKLLTTNFDILACSLSTTCLQNY